MTCGCQPNAYAPPMDLAASCFACPHGGLRAVRCGAGDRPTIAEVTLLGRRCPTGRHPTKDAPNFRWVGMNWRGAPWPIRVWVHALGGPHPEDFSACGCIERVKTWLEGAGACAWRWPARFWRAVGVGR